MNIVKKQKCILKLHLFLSDVSYIFADSGNSFQILEEHFEFSQCDSYRHDTLLILINTTDSSSVTFLSLDNHQNNKLSPDL